MSTDPTALTPRLAIDASWSQPAEHDGRVRLVSINDERTLFWRYRRRALVNLFIRSFEQSRLRLILVVLLTALLWTAMFWLFADGFRYLAVAIQDAVTHDETVRLLFSVFFASLTIMLVFSTGILLYGAIYRSDEVRFLLTLPATDERIFLHKFQESLLFSSWAFLLLASPMLLAYGVTAGAGWAYYAMLLPSLICFAFIPGSVGAIGCLLAVRFLAGRQWTLWLPVVIGLGLVLLMVARLLLGSFENDWMTPAWFQEMIGRLRFADYRLLPNWWLSTGLLEAARGSWTLAGERRALRESLMFLALLFSNALFLQMLAVQCAGFTLRAGYSRLHGGGPSRRRTPAMVPKAWPAAAARLVPTEIRLLILKDLRLFRRDPLQWSQFLIFLSLLSLYFINVRKLTADVEYVTWVNMISFLNLAIIGLIQSTFTTRFVFPLISLEGRRFWILGLLPVERDAILWGKFLFAAIGAWIPCTALVFLSDLMLGVESDVVLVHVLVCTLLCSGLSGIAVGLGARFPNLRHDSPSRIAAGFGGTLTLILSTGYIMSIVMLAAASYQLESLVFDTSGWLGEDSLRFWWTIGLTASFLFGAAATIVPMRVGLRAFRSLEV